MTSVAAVDGVLEQANGFQWRGALNRIGMLTRKIHYQDSRLVKPK